MSRSVVFLAISMSISAQGQPLGIGKPASPEEIARWDITVYPDGKGLPVGSGNAQRGANNLVKSVGSYWPYATTLFDYRKPRHAVHSPPFPPKPTRFIRRRRSRSS